MVHKPTDIVRSIIKSKKTTKVYKKQELLEYIVKSIGRQTKMMLYRRRRNWNWALFCNLSVNEEDMGQVIGKQAELSMQFVQ